MISSRVDSVGPIGMIRVERRPASGEKPLDLGFGALAARRPEQHQHAHRLARARDVARRENRVRDANPDVVGRGRAAAAQDPHALLVVPVVRSPGDAELCRGPQRRRGPGTRAPRRGRRTPLVGRSPMAARRRTTRGVSPVPWRDRREITLSASSFPRRGRTGGVGRSQIAQGFPASGRRAIRSRRSLLVRRGRSASVPDRRSLAHRCAVGGCRRRRAPLQLTTRTSQPAPGGGVKHWGCAPMVV